MTKEIPFHSVSAAALHPSRGSNNEGWDAVMLPTDNPGLVLLPFVHIFQHDSSVRRVFGSHAAPLCSEADLWKFLSAKTNSQTCHFLCNLRFLTTNCLTDWVYLHFRSVVSQNQTRTLARRSTSVSYNARLFYCLISGELNILSWKKTG